MQTKKSTDIPKREFAFSHEFPNEVTLALKAYDRVFKELTSINAGKNECKEDYGICNNLYKFRYITPSDIATYTSNLIKVLHSHMIHPQIADLEKFSVMSVKQFMIDHSCVPIEHSSIYGLYNYTTDNMTLKDLLVLCENDFYHTTVVSKYEMQQRAKAIKDDYKTIADMHFSTNIQKIIEGLPNLMNQTEFASMPYLEQKVIQTYIEEFILFTIMMNTVIMSNMIFFCVPKSTFDTKLMDGKSKYDTNNLIPDENVDDDVVTESVDLTKSHDIYIVLTEGTEWVSRQVKKHTMSRFSHAGLAFDPSLRKVYSFGMSNPLNEDTKSDNGFRMDDMGNDHHKGVEFTVYGAYVTEDQYKLMKKYADEIKNAPKTKYSIGSVIRQLFNDDKPVNRKSSHQICSTFVNEILKHANINVTEKNYPAPGDFEKSVMTKMNMFEHVYSGTYDEYDEEDVMERMRAFAERSKSKRLEKGGNVVTECCLLKTNTMRCTSKLPFDINMRNIVLQDMHPHFKDTVSAIEFITTDTRSPIAQMLYRYGHPSEVINGLDGMMICKMFMNGQCGIEMNYDELNNKLHEIDFHTDVNWLDKIAYGNTFIDGDYRGEDAVGNDHRHPIQQTLDLLYRMFTEKDLTTKEELSEHIIKIAHLMKSICGTYGACGMNNWEMVRDILAVLGEIMTRAMIKLYTNHMTIIASDNMDDVDAPGYMYTESFYDYIKDDVLLESYAQPNPSIKGQDVSNGNKLKAALQKIREFISKLINKFVAWIQNVLNKISSKFTEEHQREVAFVKKNNKINSEISAALKSGKFHPTIVNWPLYRINMSKIIRLKLSDIVKKHIENEQDEKITADELKKEFYPEEIFTNLKSNKVHAEAFQYMDISLNDLYMETVDLASVKPLYVCIEIRELAIGKKSKLSMGDFVWDTSALLTDSRAFHAALSLTPDLKNCYSYHPNASYAVSLNNVKDPIKRKVSSGMGGGFMSENLTSSPGTGDKHVLLVYVAFISNEKFEHLEEELMKLEENLDFTSYEWNQIIAHVKGKDLANSDDFTYVCSTFTNAFLKKVGIKVTNLNNPSPGDIKRGMLTNKDFSLVYIGNPNKYNESDAIRRTNEFAKEIRSAPADKNTDGVITGPDLTKQRQNESENIRIIKNYLLFGDINGGKIADKLTDEIWIDLINNIVDSGKALETFMKATIADNKQTIALLKTMVDKSEKELSNMSEQITDDDISEKYLKVQKKFFKYKDLLTSIIEISNEYELVFANCMRIDFYKTSYQLYRDTVSIYKQQRKLI
jgi:hypothetical protein